MKAIVTYYSAKDNLAVILTQLQSQLVPPEEVIVIDTSPDKSGLEICQKFNTNSGTKITVECARVGIYEAWNHGLDIAGKDSDVIIMNDDLIIPQNLIDVMTVVLENTQCYCLVPDTPPKEHYKQRVSVNFQHYGRLPETLEDLEMSRWMPGFCFVLTKKCLKDVGEFDDKHFKIWYGDDDYQNRIMKAARINNVLPILKVKSAYVYHFGGKSYQYQNKEVRKIIDKDRKSYVKKYPPKNKVVLPTEVSGHN